MSKLQLEPEHGTVHFRAPDLELNLGAIGKGHALDRLAAELRDAGVDQALLCAGKSSLLAVGGAWPVDLRSPQIADHPLARLELADGALATSGAGEQFVIIDGRRYGHIIDPRTGWPAVGLLSVSVVTRDAARADALATAFFVGGLDLARRYCEEHDDVLAVVTPDDEERRPQLFGRYRGVRSGDRVSLSASRVAPVALVLLRTLIGWHFLYEGYFKLMQPAWSAAGAPLPPWSAAGFLGAVDRPGRRTLPSAR